MEDKTFEAIDVLQNNSIVGARGNNVDFFSEGGNVVKGWKAKDNNQQVFSPTKLLSHGKDQKLLVLNKNKRNDLHNFDTETGKNLGNLDVRLFQEDIPCKIDNLVYATKYGQYEPSSVINLVATSGNSMFKIPWDTRTDMKKFVPKADKSCTIKKKTTFNAVTTTSKGHVAVGCKDGHVRLYTKDSLKTAKADYGFIADSITGLDVSYDGNWLVWTTEKYLLVIKVTFNGKSSFEKKLKQDERNGILILRIPDDLLKKFNIKNLKLSPARFDNGHFQGLDEQEIVTTSGKYVIRFPFKLVKEDYCKENGQKKAIPIIYKQSQKVVDKRFAFGKNVVVAALEEKLNPITLNEEEEELVNKFKETKINDDEESESETGSEDESEEESNGESEESNDESGETSESKEESEDYEEEESDEESEEESDEDSDESE